MPEPLEPPAALDAEVARSIREFLLRMAEDPDLLVEYVRNPLAVLAETELGPEAQALLLDGNFSRVHTVMKQSSTPVRWLVIWLV